MKYRSKKGTVIDIPDSLTPKQIASIKADADAGYGTRAQQTANSLAGGGSSSGGGSNGSKRDPAKVDRYQEAVKRIAALQPGTPEYQNNADIIKTIGSEYGFHWQDKIKSVAAAPAVETPPVETGPAPGTVADQSGYQPGAEPKPAYPDTPFQDPGGVITEGIVTPKGEINPVSASDVTSKAETNDLNTNFQMEHPQLITDENGNSREITRHKDGTVTVKDTAGGISKTFKDLATAAAETFNGTVSRQKAEEATYGTLTKYYDRDKGRENEDAKQELADRGIQYDPAAAQDPNTKDLYGRTIGGIDQKYRGLKDTAAQQAVISGNQAYATDAAARDSFLTAAINGASTFSGNFGPYTNNTTTDSSQDTKDILGMSASQYMTKYGIDQDTYTTKLAIAKSGSGGGGGGSTAAKSEPAGFEILG